MTHTYTPPTEDQYRSSRRLQAHFVSQAERAGNAYLQALKALEELESVPHPPGLLVADLKAIDEHELIQLPKKWNRFRAVQEAIRTYRFL